ncbi:hypothetical protein ARAM_002826 [Aspergillus rambellii]|uniref:Translation elongation factor eEF-1B gamma subunit n=1 Tax=Aspergillus rambellii TaxID=308745 RepID=A0A0F8U568_9EURO|nr:hypothetical protein ARAM_002826 [Aspergillus rambellii]
MAPFGTIYSYPNNPRVGKVLAVANLNNLEIEVPPFQMGVTNRTPEFLAKFPMGKVPAFSAADGTNIFESDAIAQFVAESGPAAGQLVGSTPAERAVIRQWIAMADNEIGLNIVLLVLPRIGVSKFDEATEAAALERLERGLACLDKHLAGSTWLAPQEKLSLADITLAAALSWGYAMIIDAEMRAKYPALLAWYKKTMDSEGVKGAFGELKFIEKREIPQ